MTDDTPRDSGQQDQTGTGSPRSADDSPPEPEAVGDGGAPVDPAVTVGATTGSHPAEADGLDINRSGSGGSGGAATADEENQP